MTSIIEPRLIYKPFEYQEAADFWLKQQQAHWLHTEVPMMSDLTDWNSNLNETEKNIIGSILKGFAQTETVVNDYWSGLVTKWFRKPEIIMMATTQDGLGDTVRVGHPAANYIPGYYTWTEEKKDPFGVEAGVGLDTFPRIKHPEALFNAVVF
jgi:hypothetical protein